MSASITRSVNIPSVTVGGTVSLATGSVSSGVVMTTGSMSGTVQIGVVEPSASFAAYLDATNGNDALAQIDNIYQPFLTIAAAVSALNAAYPSDPVSLILLTDMTSGDADISSVMDRLTIKSNSGDGNVITGNLTGLGVGTAISLDGIECSVLYDESTNTAANDNGGSFTAISFSRLTITARGQNGVAGASASPVALVIAAVPFFAANGVTGPVPTDGDPGVSVPDTTGSNGGHGTSGGYGWDIAVYGNGSPASLIVNANLSAGNGGNGGFGQIVALFGGWGGNGGSATVPNTNGKNGGPGGNAGNATAGTNGNGGNGGNGGNLTLSLGAAIDLQVGSFTSTGGTRGLGVQATGSGSAGGQGGLKGTGIPTGVDGSPGSPGSSGIATDQPAGTNGSTGVDGTYTYV